MNTIPKASIPGMTFLIISLIVSGAATEVRSQAVTIDLIRGCENNKTIKLSEIASQINLVKLETTKECLIGRTDKLYSFNDDWFIQFGGLLRFDHNGKYLNKISRKGKGPGEYIEISGICFNHNNGHAYIINRSTAKAMEFSLDGKLTGSSKNDGVKSVLLNNQYFVNYFNQRALYLADGYRITVVDLKGKIQKKLLHQKIPEDFTHLPSGNWQIENFRDSVTVFDSGCDTMYRISSDLKITPRYILNLGREAVPRILRVTGSSPDYWDEVNRYSYVYRFMETDRFLFLEVLRKGNFIKMIYNKVNGDCFSMEQHSVLVIDDLDLWSNFWPMGTTEDGQLYPTCGASLMEPED